VENVSYDHNEDVFREFSDLFQGEIGSLPGKVHLQVDPTITPHVAAARRVPVALKPRLKAELDKLVKNNVIEPVSNPTNWVSGLALVVKPNGKLRVCIDPRPLNKALRREHFQLPVLEDILPDLANAKIFTTLDLKNGFWHLRLDKESSDLTTFATPFGRYKWNVLPFGLAPAPEIFQRHVYDNVCDLDGVLNVADDLLVYGKGNTEAEALADHDMKLKKLLLRCQERGMRLNPEKLKLRQKSLSFLGHQVTNEGLRPDPNKVKAIQEMPVPTDMAAVQRLGGFVNYLAKFLPQISTVMSPIRNLTKAGTPWNWSEVQDKAFTEVKRLVSEAPILRYYDANKPLTIQCDSSEKGLGAALLQEEQPLAYISRALTETECRYAQIEKELLAIVYSLERFHQYTFANKVTVLSDHRPLESIMKKDLVKCPKRLQNMLMRLQQYDVTVKYHPGKKMYLADTLSRAFKKDDYNSQSKDNLYRADVREVDYIPIKEERLEELRMATQKDMEMQELIECILKGWPENKVDLCLAMRPYFQFRTELSVQDGLIFRGNRVVVPESQREVLKERLHSSHIGAEGCCRRARECLYWPGMNQDIKDLVAKCSICRTYERSNAAEPLMSHEVPDRPWAKVGVDLFNFDGTDYLCTVDYMSNFWEIDRLRNTEAKTVISKLKRHFARFGIPDQVVSDNGPQFSCREFANFAKKWSFVHTPTSPYNSKGNGKAESAVKTAKNLLLKAGDPYLAMLDHRNTPAPDLSPAQKLLSRRTKTLLPTTEALLKPQIHSCVKEATRHKLTKQKNYFDQKSVPLKPLKKGDVVRMKPHTNGSKIWKKGVVLDKLDTRSYSIQVDGNTIRRNRVDLKKSKEPAPSHNVPNSQIQVPPVTPSESLQSVPVVPPKSPPKPPNKRATNVKGSATPLECSDPKNTGTAIKKTSSGRVVQVPKKLEDFVV
jgi:hypothetical protein